MTAILFLKHFKRNILKYTVALSAAVHLVAFYFFPTWESSSNPDREKVIKVKYVLEKKEPPEEKVSPESKKIISPNFRPRSAIIKNVKVSPTPPSVKRNPVPIRNSENLFKPVNTVLKHASIPHPVSESKRMAPLDISQSMRPSPRMNREVQNNQNTQVLTQLAVRSKDPTDSLNKSIQNKPAPQLINSSVFKKVISQNSTVQAKSVTDVKYESSQNPTSLASTQLSNENSYPLKTASIQKPLPVTLGEMPSNSQPVAGIKNVAIAGIPGPSTHLMAKKPQTLNKPGTVVRVGKENFKPLARTGQAMGTLAQTPQSLDMKLVAHYQPAISIAATHFTSPLNGSSLLKEANIPPGFSDEKPNQGEEITRPPEKVARLSDGVSDLPAELLNQIKSGFSAKIRSRIAQVKYYPRIARNRGFEGQPVVAFTLGNGGELLELSIVNPSPFKLLDEAALDAVKSASPYPPIPELLKIKSMKFNLPISFMLEER